MKRLFRHPASRAAFLGLALASLVAGCEPRAPLAPSVLEGDVAYAEAGEAPKALGHYKKIGDATYLLVLQPGAKLLKSLQAFQAAARITAGSVSGVGVTRNTTLGFYKFNEDGTPARTHTDDTVKDPREVVGLTCNFTTKVVEDGKPDVPSTPHCHIALAGMENPVADAGKGWPVVGGHLIEAEVAVTAELIINAYPGTVIKRPSAPFGGFLVDVTEGQGGKALTEP